MNLPGSILHQQEASVHGSAWIERSYYQTPERPEKRERPVAPVRRHHVTDGSPLPDVSKKVRSCSTVHVHVQV